MVLAILNAIGVIGMAFLILGFLAGAGLPENDPFKDDDK